MNIEKISYLEGGRQLCVTGTAILTASNEFLGKSIRFFEGNDAWCNHAAAVVRFPQEFVCEDRVTLIESLEHGPTPTYLSHYFDDFDGKLFLIIPNGLTEYIKYKFSIWCMDKVFSQIKYDYASIGKQIFGHVKEDGEELFCSEFLGMAWEHSGIERLDTAPKGLAPQPSDITTWYPIQKIYELVGPFK